MNKPKSNMFKYLLSLLKGNGLITFVLLLIVLFTTFLTIIQPYYSGLMIDIIKIGEPEYTFSYAMKFSVFILVITILMNVTKYIYTYMSAKLGNRIVRDLRSKLFGHVLTLGIEYHNSLPKGVLASRITNDTAKLEELYSGVLVNLFKNIIILIGLTIFMLLLDVTLTLVILTSIPLLILTIYLYRKFSSKAYNRLRTNVNAMNGFLSEQIKGMEVLQNYNNQQLSINNFDVKNESKFKARVNVLNLFTVLRPTLYIIRMAGTVLIWYFGGKGVIDGRITIGLLLSFTFYLNVFFTPVEEIGDQINAIQDAISAANNIKGILDTKPDVIDRKEAKEISEFKGKIEFKNVNFSYSDGKRILSDVSFVIYPGRVAAFVGATGSGKSTILKLLGRYHAPTSGDIYIDDINIKDIKLSSLRRNIGQMLQEVSLFTTTIKDNITLFEENFSDEEITEILEYTNADKFISKYNNGINELVIEDGANLSAGQKQLVSFSRTLIRKPNILVLDEATANIDTETEILIQDTLDKMMNIGTMLIVAHRLSTIQNSDIIFVVDSGRIVEEGNHKELLRAKGKYYNYYTIQSKKEELNS